jgi:molecular chaperone HtpG
MLLKGVIDCPDLPLNVSREMLQDDAVIRKIKSAVTSKILSTLLEMKEKKAETYKTFYTTFGRIVKEGIHTDWENADRIKKLALYPSAKTEDGALISLDDYIKAMPADQKDIYYLAAERLEEARHSPQLEQALKHGCDVLFFVDPVDEWLVDSFREYEGKKLVDIAKGDVQFGSEEERKAEKEANEKAAADLKPFLEAVKEQLKEQVADVRVSTRLTDSPCCLVAGANALSASMERMLRAMKQEVPHEKRTLEINAAHPLVAKMKDLTGEALSDAVELLYDQALIAEGSAVPDPGRFTKLLTALMLK